jgi:hypothetical protein
MAKIIAGATRERLQLTTTGIYLPAGPAFGQIFVNMASLSTAGNLSCPMYLSLLPSRAK